MSARPVCSVADCGRPVRAVGMCGPHYGQRWHRDRPQAPRVRPDTSGDPVVEVLAAVLAGAPSLPGARCRNRSHLFDERGVDEPPEVAEQRHQQAIGLCRVCPALASCQQWYADLPARKRPPGVVAGIITTPTKEGRSAS
ncbi:hypothetical protein [Mycobacterium sp. UM_WGJ]|uniref:hypothetical protein n=1 Tax=Mycobacterium sp. UM_WGJ TaxID=1370120 RepID=UPI001E6451F6|nr:hypothetical protein [Mycobacterium sp. UM_WGJ]